MSEDRPLSVAIGLIVKDNKVLLLKRIKEPFKGYWGFPGGKVEKGEHIEEAVLREIKEETGIDAEFVKLKALVSEHVFEHRELKHHFMLHYCLCKPLTEFIKSEAEGETTWLEYDLPFSLENIIPSDKVLVEEVLTRKNEGYFTSKVNNQENVIEFNQVSKFTS